MKVNNNNLERFVNVAVLISYKTEKSVYDAKEKYQSQYLAEICKAKRLVIQGWYTDTKIKDTDFKGIGTLIESCQHGEIDILVIDNNRDNGSKRNLYHILSEKIKRDDIKMIYMKEHKTVMSEFDMKEIFPELENSTTPLLEDYINCYGYEVNIETCDIRIKNDQYKKIRFMVDSMLSNMSLLIIAYELRRIYHEDDWTQNRIAKILKDKRYRTSINTKEAIIPPIITASEYESLKHFYALPSDILPDFLEGRRSYFYSEKIICGFCGSLFTRVLQNQKSEIWKCLSSRTIKGFRCESKKIHVEALDEICWKSIEMVFESLNRDIDAFIEKFHLDRYYNDSFAEIRQLEADIKSIDQTMLIIKRNIENQNLTVNSVSKLLEVTRNNLNHKKCWYLEREMFYIDFREYIEKLKSYLIERKERPEINRYIFDDLIYKIVIGDPTQENVDIVKVLMKNAKNKNLNGKAECSFEILDRNLSMYYEDDTKKNEVCFKTDVNLYY